MHFTYVILLFGVLYGCSNATPSATKETVLQEAPVAVVNEIPANEVIVMPDDKTDLEKAVTLQADNQNSNNAEVSNWHNNTTSHPPSAPAVSESAPMEPTIITKGTDVIEHEQFVYKADIIPPPNEPSIDWFNEDNTDPYLEKLHFALKSDLVMLGGIMPDFQIGPIVPNISAEFYISRHWSVQIGGDYSNWNSLAKANGLYALWGAELEPRFWFFGKRRCSGLYLGLYGVYGEYDMQGKPDANAQFTGETGAYIVGGASLGWMLPLGRRNHFYLDFGARYGYRHAKSSLYTFDSGHYYFDDTQVKGKFAPQVRLQIVYRFGRKGDR